MLTSLLLYSLIATRLFKILLSSPIANKVACCNVYKEYLNCVLIWLLYAGGRVTIIFILKLYIKVSGQAINKEGCISDIRNYYRGGRPEGLLMPVPLS